MQNEYMSKGPNNRIHLQSYSCRYSAGDRDAWLICTAINNWLFFYPSRMNFNRYTCIYYVRHSFENLKASRLLITVALHGIMIIMQTFVIKRLIWQNIGDMRQDQLKAESNRIDPRWKSMTRCNLWPGPVNSGFLCHGYLQGRPHDGGRPGCEP